MQTFGGRSQTFDMARRGVWKKINPKKRENSLTRWKHFQSRKVERLGDRQLQLSLHFPMRIFNVIANAPIQRRHTSSAASILSRPVVPCVVRRHHHLYATCFGTPTGLEIRVAVNAQPCNKPCRATTSGSKTTSLSPWNMCCQFRICFLLFLFYCFYTLAAECYKQSIKTKK